MEIKILAVDDEKHITDLLVNYFSYHGYQITGVNDPVQALELIKKDNFLVCLLDIQMPNMDGLELLKQIKAFNAMTGVIMITARASTNNLLTCLRRGAETCFLKPLDDLDSLRKAVDKVISRFKNWQKLIQSLKKKESQTLSQE